jgi:hypothetical protein
LLTGAELVEDGNIPLPPQIVLFLENLLELAEGNENFFHKEVRTTFFA